MSEEEDDDSSLSTILTEGCSEGGSNESSSSIPTACETSLACIDIGTLVLSAHGSLDHLKQLAKNIPDVQRMHYLAFHSKPASRDVLQSHSVTKKGKTWSVKFQQRWLDQFPWLSYSSVLAGGICRYCVLFPEQPPRGGSLGAKPGVLVLSAYQKPYTKALGKDGILVFHDKSIMHQHAAQQADLFKQNFRNPAKRIDSQLMKQKVQQEEENKEILRHIILAVEFLAK